MDEKRVWGLKKIGTLIDCDVLGRAAASEATTATERVLHPHLLQLLGIVVESLGAACVLAAVPHRLCIAGGDRPARCHRLRIVLCRAVSSGE